jgi:hypothetical protein
MVKTVGELYSVRFKIVHAGAAEVSEKECWASGITLVSSWIDLLRSSFSSTFAMPAFILAATIAMLCTALRFNQRPPSPGNPALRPAQNAAS